MFLRILSVLVLELFWFPVKFASNDVCITGTSICTCVTDNDEEENGNECAASGSRAPDTVQAKVMHYYIY